MRTVKMFLALMMVCFFAAQVNAQGNSQNPNGNAVLSEVDAYNHGDGTATISMKFSGNLSGTIDVVKFYVTGDLIPGGSFGSYIDHSKLLAPNPIFVTTIPIKEFSNTTQGNPNEWIDVEVIYSDVSGGPKKWIKKARMPKLVTGKCQGCF
ncbi:MAG: hypothetical protein IPP17_24625 [Bacteroidetes bacterium]|nr:hypothetical protein [Bacteroidota bacterium]